MESPSVEDPLHGLIVKVKKMKQVLFLVLSTGLAPHFTGPLVQGIVAHVTASEPASADIASSSDVLYWVQRLDLRQEEDVMVARSDLRPGDTVTIHGEHEQVTEGQIPSITCHLIIVTQRHSVEYAAVWDAQVQEKSQAQKKVERPNTIDEPCLFWLNNRRCHKQFCARRHDPIDSAAFIEARASLHAQKKREQQEREAGEAAHGKEPHSQRANVFAEWLLSQFNSDCFTHVLDVAGGRGDTLLALRRKGVSGKLSLVDPRQRPVSKGQRKEMKACQVEEPYFTYYEHLFNDEFLAGHLDQLEDVSLIVGMHPDQATEPIVDFALSMNIPFAVVPCCVYSREFPHRRRADGARVTTYDDLIEYLHLKAQTHPGYEGDVSHDTVGVSGANSVVLGNFGDRSMIK